MSVDKVLTKIEFGDFQTPAPLAAEICRLLRTLIELPHTIVEPTCGLGNIFLAALAAFPSVKAAIGIDINEQYISDLQQQITVHRDRNKVQLISEDFFQASWLTILRALPEPILIVGNPPWVTSAGLTAIDRTNLPLKTNFQGFSGLDAITGKSNFDISEWMLIHLLEQLNGRTATLAMLCKTSVARRVLAFAWQKALRIHDTALYLIDAKQHFNAAVDACLLICHISASEKSSQHCQIYDNLAATLPHSTFGYAQNQLIAELNLYEKWQHLCGVSPYQWRSGIKHDCAKVMELRSEDGKYRNGLDELVHLEPTYIFPLLKSSELAKAQLPLPVRSMVVPQTAVGDDTHPIKQVAPQTWHYLSRHASWLDKRKSTIYRKQPPFAIFGVGSYTFAPWKVAISGLYKQLHFAVVGPHQDKPVVFDDTCYFVACDSAAEAELLTYMLNSEIARQFFTAFIFWDSKRPITANLLNQLDLFALAKELDCLPAFQQVRKQQTLDKEQQLQLSLFV